MFSSFLLSLILIKSYTETPRNLIIVVFVFLFFLNGTISYFFYHDAKRSISGSENKSFIDPNHVRVFLMLVIFNIGSVSAYNYYKDYMNYQESLLANQGYTIALRAWGCEVEFSDIKVHYLNSKYEWEEVKDLRWPEKSIWSGKGIGHLKDEGVYKHGMIPLTLKNEAVVLDPKFLNNGRGSKKIRFVSKVKLKEIDSGLEELKKNNSGREHPFYSVQFIMNMPISQKAYDVNTPDYYNAIEFFFENLAWAKLRNPMLDLDKTDGAVLLAEEKIEKTNYDMDFIKKNFPNVKTTTDKDGESLKVEKGTEIMLSATAIDDVMTLTIIDSKSRLHKELYKGKTTTLGLW